MAEKTELEIQNEIRKRLDMPALTELPPTPEEIQAKKEAEAQAEKDRIAAEAESKRLADEKKLQEEESRKKEYQPKELDENAILAEIQKVNPSIKSLSDLKPKPSEDDLQREREAREGEKISWGLKNGKFKKKELEDYFSESKDPSSLVFNQYASKVKEANSDLTDEQIKEMFDERYGLNKDPESWQYKQGQEELQILAGQYLSKKYSNIISLENDYAAHERTQNELTSTQAKILANAPAYRKDVEDAFSKVGTYKTKIGEEEFEVQLPTGFIDRAKAHLLSDNYASSQIKNGWSKEELEATAVNLAYIENKDFIHQKIAEQYHLNRQKGSRGIVPPIGARTSRTEIDMDEKLKLAAERHGVVLETKN